LIAACTDESLYAAENVSVKTGVPLSRPNIVVEYVSTVSVKGVPEETNVELVELVITFCPPGFGNVTGSAFAYPNEQTAATSSQAKSLTATLFLMDEHPLVVTCKTAGIGATSP
jgi:hypothetical protein